MLMAVVPDYVDSPLPILDEASDGVVSYSVPVLGGKGDSVHFTPSVSGYDYVVASWGDGSYYTFHLAEKVWMTLGLTPRCIGNDQQRLVYDDLGLPEFNVAEGEISFEYHYHASRSISWRMSNSHLRKYLWMRGARGVRAFFYEARISDSAEVRMLMKGDEHISLRPDGDWCEVDIREHLGGLLLQVWATVDAVSCSLSPEQTAENLLWPGFDGEMTHRRADALTDISWVYLDDLFLEKYEQSGFYDTTPILAHGRWLCSPSYRGQWSFTECERVGRNLVRVPMRELYKPKPDQEILHAHRHATDPQVIQRSNMGEEHIPAKVQRMLDQMLAFGDHLSVLARGYGIDRQPAEIVTFDRGELGRNGWRAYPQLQRLAQVAPLQMSEQAMLVRCKSLHELWQVIPNGLLRRLLQVAGCPQPEIRDLGSLKLLQGLHNIVARLDASQEDAASFASTQEPHGWKERNSSLAALFVLNDLRIADAHDTFSNAVPRLQDLGFDTATLRQGHGRALDFVFDSTIDSFSKINGALGSLIAR